MVTIALGAKTTTRAEVCRLGAADLTPHGSGRADMLPAGSGEVHPPPTVSGRADPLPAGSGIADPSSHTKNRAFAIGLLGRLSAKMVFHMWL